ncbi:hypothetical protein D3C75_1156280 [compost metagenome]
MVQARQQAENLRLGGRFHGVGGFIGNQQARLIGQGDGDHHFLAFAVGQLIGEAAHNVLVILDAHAVQ